MSKKQKAKNREIIRMVGERLIQGLTLRLTDAAMQYRIITRWASTGSVYVYIKIIGRRRCGAAVRISDHRKKHTDRWVNFSRPAKRFYGIWCFNPMPEIDSKASRIVANIVRLHEKRGDV